ncbi:MAG: hypothetical protein U0Q10_05950 [Dermatophilaceae bacterium]
MKLSTVNGVETLVVDEGAETRPALLDTSSRPAATRPSTAAYVSPRRIHSVPAHGANPSAHAKVMISWPYAAWPSDPSSTGTMEQSSSGRLSSASAQRSAISLRSQVVKIQWFSWKPNLAGSPVSPR